MTERIEVAALNDISDDAQHVMILSTARRHARGVQRLPDRFDRGRRVAAVQVETDEQAREIFHGLDVPGRVLYVDVERKQDLHLMEVARKVVLHAEVRQIKPNDLTVDALQALLVDRIGPDLTNVPITVVGTGNLGFKFALRLAESGAEIGLVGRSEEKEDLLVRALGSILPAYTPHKVSAGRLPSSRVLIGAVTAEGIIDTPWLESLSPSAICIDVGIGNLAPTFIAAAIRAGHECVRLDVRSAGDPLPLHPNPFFSEVAGRREMAGASIVAGGLIGELGEIVVDKIADPTTVIGVARGNGSLLPPHEWSSSIAEAVRRVDAAISA